MSQGDVYVFNDLPKRIMDGDLVLTKNMYLTLIDNTRLATPSDANADISDYTQAIVSKYAADVDENGRFRFTTTYKTPPSNFVYWATPKWSFVAIGSTQIMTVTLEGLQGLQVYLESVQMHGPEDGSSWVPEAGAPTEALIDFFTYPVWFPRIPRLNNVYQAVIFHRKSEEENPCVCYVDLTTDDGITPFNLDYFPLKINFGDRVNGYYKYFSNARRVFTVRGA